MESAAKSQKIVTEDEINKMNRNEIRNELRRRGLKLSGKKSELVIRLKAAIVVEGSKAVEDEEDEEDDEEDEEDGEDEVEDEIEDAMENKTEEDDLSSQAQKPHLKLSVKDVEELLEKFTGDGRPSVQRWVSDFEEMAALYEWNQLEKITFAKRLLQGSAKRFVYYENCGKTWLKLKRSLLEEFGETIDSIKVHRELSRRKKYSGESYQDYIYIMMEIAGQGDIERRSLIQYIIEGIQDEPSNKSILYGAKTIKELKEKFKQYDSMKKESNVKGKVKKGDEKTEGYRSKEHKVKGVVGSSVQSRRCFNCGDQDHLSSNCPSKEKGVKCFRCNEFGHIATKCPSVSKNACLVSCLKKTKYQAEVVIDNKKFVALIDTGSDLSLIRSDEYNKIGSPTLGNRQISFEGLGSKNNKTLGEFKTTISMNDLKIEVAIHVVDQSILNYSIILGTDFLDKVDLHINQGVISVTKPEQKNDNDEMVPYIYKIDVCENTADVGLSHIRNPLYRDEIESMIKQYNPEVTKDVDIETKIILKDDTPVAYRPRRLSPSEKQEVDQQLKEWQKDGIIRPSNSEYASPIVLVKKKNGDTRICIDYRSLNKLIERPRYPLPLIEDQLDALQDAKVFTLIDLKNGFFHVPIAEGCQKFTAFVTPTGQFEFLKTPFGLSISPIIFQKFINAVFKDLIEQKILVTYMDDIIVVAKHEEDAIERTRITLEVAAQHGLRINWTKCRFLQTTIEYLGYIVSNGTIKPSTNKTKAVINFPQPKNIKNIQSFLGLTGYFRKFIPQYATIARPLTDLLKKDVPFEFGNRELEAFKTLKMVLAIEPVLQLYKVEAETELHTDASQFGYGVILMQRNDEDQKFHPVYYASGKTTPAEEKYTSYELEVLAVIKALKKFRVYLLGIKFKIITDCQAFSLTMKKKDLSVRVARWVLLLEEFTYEICHRAGKNMKHVDALSRYPLPNVLLIKESEDGMLTRLRRAQNADEKIQNLLKTANTNKITDYMLKNGILYKCIKDDFLIVVPEDMQIQVIRRAHERGHFGVTKTEEIVKQDFWFESLREKVERVVASCFDCILAERKHGKQEGFLYTIEKGDLPLDTYHIDHLGPMTATKKRYQNIFIVVDAFTKFVWLYPTKSTDAAAVVECLRRQSSIFGNPRRIVSDRGSAFTSAMFKNYCDDEDIEHVLITTGVPRSNGQVERVNRTLIPLLTKLAAPVPDNWYKFVHLAQQYLNSTTSRTTGKAPFHIMFGVNMRIKNEQSVKELLEQEWEQGFEEERNELRKNAREKILKMQAANRKSYNKNRKSANSYVEGDLVAIKRTQFGSGLKLHGKFLGPYEVVRVLRNNRYAVEKRGQHDGPRNTTTTADFMKSWDASDIQ